MHIVNGRLSITWTVHCIQGWLDFSSSADGAMNSSASFSSPVEEMQVRTESVVHGGSSMSHVAWRTQPACPLRPVFCIRSALPQSYKEPLNVDVEDDASSSKHDSMHDLRLLSPACKGRPCLSSRTTVKPKICCLTRLNLLPTVCGCDRQAKVRVWHVFPSRLPEPKPWWRVNLLHPAGSNERRSATEYRQR